MEDIDVSKCCYLINYDPPKGQGDWCGAIHKGACKIYSKDCKYNENCYYKQLSKFKAENIRLKSYLQEIKRILIFYKQELDECLHNDIDGKILDLITKLEEE